MLLLSGCTSATVSNETSRSNGTVGAASSLDTVVTGESTPPDVGSLAEVLVPVTPSVAPDGAVSGTIGPEAPLTLDATAPDGTSFHVEFDQGASVVAVTITMTPLTDLDGLVGFAAGVDFQPAGLMLVSPAVLTIEGPSVSATSRAFRYQHTAQGEAAAPAMVVADDGPLRLVIGHFSGYGAVNETPNQWNIGDISASEAQEIVSLEEFVISNTLGLLRSHTLSQAEADNVIATALDAIADAAQRLGESVLRTAETGNVDAAAQAEIEAAIVVIFQAERAAELTGLETSGSAIRRAVSVMRTYLTGVTKRCRDTHDLTVLTLLVSLSRGIALLGGPDDATQDESFRKCMSAEVHFTTSITISQRGGIDNLVVTGALTIEGRATVDLFDQLPSVGGALVIASDLVVHFRDCEALISVQGGTFSVQKASLLTNPNPTPPTPESTYVPPLEIVDASVLLSLGSPTPRPIDCENLGEPGDFLELFDNLHPQEHQGGGSYLFDRGFEIPGTGSALLARRTIDRQYVADSLGDTTYLSTTVIELTHTP
jgi:hypothetical protein